MLRMVIEVLAIDKLSDHLLLHILTKLNSPTDFVSSCLVCMRWCSLLRQVTRLHSCCSRYIIQFVIQLHMCYVHFQGLRGLSKCGDDIWDDAHPPQDLTVFFTKFPQITDDEVIDALQALQVRVCVSLICDSYLAKSKTLKALKNPYNRISLSGHTSNDTECSDVYTWVKASRAVGCYKLAGCCKSALFLYLLRLQNLFLAS